MIYLKYDDSLIEQIWEHWDSDELTIEELLLATHKTCDEKTLSEIWHLISVKSLLNTRKYSELALNKNTDEPWVHDNYVFGSGNINLDFNKKIDNSPVSFYIDYIRKFPKSIMARRILIESYIDLMMLDKADQEIKKCKIDFTEKSIIFDIYSYQIEYLNGNKEQALIELEKKAESNNAYNILLLIGETLAQIGVFDLAYSIFDNANKSQIEGNRKIDALLAQIHIQKLIKEHKHIQKHIDDILEIYKTDYGIINGEEINEIKNLQLTTTSS